MGASQLLPISLGVHLHRRVIETPGRYSRLFPAAFLVLAGKSGSGYLRGFAILALQPAWARFDHSPIQPALRCAGDRAVNVRADVALVVQWLACMNKSTKAVSSAS